MSRLWPPGKFRVRPSTSRRRPWLAGIARRTASGLALLDPVTEGRWREDGAVQVLALAGGEVVVSVQDEGGQIDLNAGPAPLLEGLLRAAGHDGGDSAA